MIYVGLLVESGLAFIDAWVWCLCVVLVGSCGAVFVVLIVLLLHYDITFACVVCGLLFVGGLRILLLLCGLLVWCLFIVGLRVFAIWFKVLLIVLICMLLV